MRTVTIDKTVPVIYVSGSDCAGGVEKTTGGEWVATASIGNVRGVIVAEPTYRALRDARLGGEGVLIVSADAAAITTARCQANHSGSHRYDVAGCAPKRGRLVGQCRGCGGYITAADAQDQPRAIAADAALVERDRRDQIARANGWTR